MSLPRRCVRRFVIPVLGVIGATLLVERACVSVFAGEEPSVGRPAIVVGPDVALRSELKTLGTLEEPTVVVRETRNGFVLVRSGGRSGWVRSDELVAPADADGYFDERLRQNPNDAEALARRGAGRRLRGDLAAAQADFDAALRANPQCVAALIGRGDLAVEQDDDAGAQLAYDELVRLRPDSPVAAVRRGKLFWKRGQIGPAAHDAQRACQTAPTYADAYVLRGMAARSIGRWSDALRDFEIAAELEPTNPAPHRETAWLYAAWADAAVRDGRRAMEAAERACNLTNWEDYESLAAWAAAEAEFGDFAAASESQQKAIAAAPAVYRERMRTTLAEYQAERPLRLKTPIVDAGLAPPPAVPAGWSEFVSQEDGFRVLFPGKPEVTHRDTKTGPSLRAAIEDKTRGLGFYVDATRTNVNRPIDPKSLIDVMRSSSLPQGATERSFREIQLPGAVAFDWEYDGADGVTVRTRFAATADHLYLAGVAGKRADFDRLSADVERFVTSFTLLKAAAKPSGGPVAGGPFSSEAGRFRVEFPAPPQEETHDSPTRRHHVFRTDVASVTYFVDYADFTAEELRQAGTPEKLLKTIRDKVVGESPVRSEQLRMIGNSPGLELVLEPGADERAIFHVYLVGLRAYQIAVLGKTEEMRKQQASLERFYQTFQIRSAVATQPTKLAVVSAEPRYGRLGPARKDWTYLPFDVLNAHLEAAGMATDAEGLIDVEGTMEFFAPDGAAVTKKPFEMRERPPAGRLPIDVMQEIPPQPGDYRLQVTVHDRRNDARTVWQQAVVVRPAEPAIVAPEFFRDAEAKVPSAAAGKVGETLYLEFRFIGFDRSQNRIDTAMTLQLIDEQGKPMLAEPVRSVFKSDDADVVRRNQVVTYFAKIALPRAGQATVRATVFDLLGGESAKLELPLTIVAP